MASNNEAKSVKFACEICLDGIYNIPSLYIIFDAVQLLQINCMACGVAKMARQTKRSSQNAQGQAVLAQ